MMVAALMGLAFCNLLDNIKREFWHSTGQRIPDQLKKVLSYDLGTFFD